MRFFGTAPISRRLSLDFWYGRHRALKETLNNVCYYNFGFGTAVARAVVAPCWRCLSL